MPIYEIVDRFQLVSGVTYRVKHYQRDLGNIIFNEYKDNSTLHIRGTIPMSTIRISIFTENHTFSRLITEEEYRSKIKDHYDKKACDTTLKMLLGESFSW